MGLHGVAMTSPLALVDRLRALPPPLCRAALAQLEAELGPEAFGALGTSWEFQRRPAQRFPTEDEIRRYPIIIFGGRSNYAAGKTRTGLEFLLWLIITGRVRVPRIVAATGAAARELVEKEESGILAWKKPGVRYNPELSKGYEGQLWVNDVRIDLMSVETPRLALGANVDVQFLDDPPKWETTGKAMLISLLKSARLGLSLTIIATTGDGIDLIADVLGVHPDNIEEAGVLLIDVGVTEDNAGNLGRHYFTNKASLERAGNWDPTKSRSPWASIPFSRLRLAECPSLVEIAVSVDPSKGGSSKPCEVGIVGGGRDARDVLHVRHDVSGVLDGGAEGWPKVAWDLAEKLHEEHPGAPFPVFVLESNVGKVYGDLLYAEERARRRATVGVGNNVRCKVAPVRADRDKCVRAEAPANVASKGQVRFAETLHVLEGQLRNLTPKGTDSDRADACNHLLTYLGKLEDGAQQVEKAQAATAAREAFRGFEAAQQAMPKPSWGISREEMRHGGGGVEGERDELAEWDRV